MPTARRPRRLPARHPSRRWRPPRRRPRRRRTRRRRRPTEAGTGINGYGDVQPAVVQIVAKGTFRDPEIGYADGSGLGSGFLISDDGVVVTNNHVVAGAATLEVYVGGELDKSYNAKVLGVSECNDLAVIELSHHRRDAAPRLVRRRHQGRPRRVRRRLPARRPGVHADQGHHRQGQGRWRPHRHVVDRPHRRARRQHPARQLGRPAGRQPRARSSPSTTPAAPGSRRPSSSTPSPRTWPSRSSTSCEHGNFESLGINGWAVADDAHRHHRHLGRRRGAGLAGRRGRHPARRHRHGDERPAGRHRRHVQGLLRRHPHRR